MKAIQIQSELLINCLSIAAGVWAPLPVVLWYQGTSQVPSNHSSTAPFRSGKLKCAFAVVFVPLEGSGTSHKHNTGLLSPCGVNLEMLLGAEVIHTVDPSPVMQLSLIHGLYKGSDSCSIHQIEYTVLLLISKMWFGFVCSWTTNWIYLGVESGKTSLKPTYTHNRNKQESLMNVNVG